MAWNLVFQGILSLKILLLFFCHYLFQPVLEIEVVNFGPFLALEVEMNLIGGRTFICVNYFLIFNFYHCITIVILTTTTLVVFSFTLLYFYILLELCLRLFFITNHSACWRSFILLIFLFKHSTAVAILVLNLS